jgi:hypothetical protein
LYTFSAKFQPVSTIGKVVILLTDSKFCKLKGLFFTGWRVATGRTDVAKRITY